jgi:type IV pilus assembly protein PilE
MDNNGAAVMRYRGKRRNMQGVTLIELLTVIGVVAILGSIAVSSYRSYTLRANRTDGTVALMKIQVAEEKYYLQNNTYTANMGQDGMGLDPANGVTSLTTPNGKYTVTIAAGGTGALATSFTATATPAGGQAQDTPCPTLTMDNMGVKGPSGTAATCWH